MRNLRANHGLRICLAGLFLWMTACATNNAPRGFLPSESVAAHNPYGGWISLDVRGMTRDQINGELLAVESDRIYVQTSRGRESVPFNRVEKATLTFYKYDALVAGWAFLGALSTASHGWYLLISFPIWLITGITASVKHSRTPRIQYPKKSWSEFQPFARFPQGLPRHISAPRDTTGLGD